jgi:membrane protease YdiL (CAAX protease family)
MGKLRDWLNRDDGRYFQVENRNLNWYEIVGILLSIVVVFLWHLNNKKIFSIPPLITVATFALAFLLSWIGIRKSDNTNGHS